MTHLAAKRSLLIPEDVGSNPAISNFKRTLLTVDKKEKEAVNGSLRMKEKTIKQNKHFGNFFARPSGNVRCPSSENSESNRI